MNDHIFTSMMENIRPLNIEERGLYTSLIALHKHEGGDLPADTTKLARMTGINVRTIDRLLPEIDHLVSVDQGSLVFHRLQQ